MLTEGALKLAANSPHEALFFRGFTHDCSPEQFNLPLFDRPNSQRNSMKRCGSRHHFTLGGNSCPGEISGTGSRRVAALLLTTLACAPIPSFAANATVVPCPARADAVIANTGRVVSSKHSLVDSYNSTLGAYGGANVGSHGTVRAAGEIVKRGGVIKGATIEHSPAGLPEIAVSAIAIPLPLGAKVPGHVELHKHHSLTLRPGDYIAAGIDLDGPAEIRVSPAGYVRIFVTGRLSIGGAANLHGRTQDLQFIVTNGSDVHIQRKGSLTGLVYAPKSEVEVNSTVFGSLVGATVELKSHAAVHYDDNLACPTAPPPTSPAIPPPALPPPPPPVVGCYMNTRNGWKNIPCATKAFIDAHFPHPDVQLTVTSPNTTPLVFGQIDATVTQVSSITDVLGSSSNANEWSFQSTTNIFAVPGGHSNAGNAAAVQFVIQSNGSASAICSWNVDVTAQSYPNQCVTPSAQQRAGGLQAFDYGNIAGYVNSNGTLSMVAELSWTPSGQPNQYAVVANDANGLAGNWTAMSGGLLGIGNGSQAQLANAEVVTQVLAATCASDTQAGSPICAPPTLQPNGTVYVGGTGTVETNNLTAVGTPTLSYLNADLQVSNVTATTSGACLGPSLVYVKDSPQDFGATPSTLGNQVFWESPDIFVVPHGTVVDVNAVSTETTVTPGTQYDVYVRVHNDLGCAPATGAKTLVYLADPSALSVQWSSITGNNYVGNNMSSTGVTVPAGGQALIGPLTFTAPVAGIGNGHKCLLAAIEADGEPAPANSTDAPNSNQVGQRNLEFVSPCVFQLTNGTASNGNVQITLTVAPTSDTPPSLTVSPDVEVTLDDADSSWFNVWNAQAGSGTAFAVTHNTATNSTTVRLGVFSVVLDPAPLMAGQSRSATGNINPTSGTLTLQLGAILTDSGGHVLANNGGSCTATAVVIK
jgi:hypothetical protein